jgi:hypothetical protein
VQFEHKTAPYAHDNAGVGAFGNTVTVGPAAVKIEPSREQVNEVL